MDQVAYLMCSTGDLIGSFCWRIFTFFGFWIKCKSFYGTWDRFLKIITFFDGTKITLIFLVCQMSNHSCRGHGIFFILIFHELYSYKSMIHERNLSVKTKTKHKHSVKKLFLNGFCPLAKYRVTRYCLYRDSLTTLLPRNVTHYKQLRFWC